MRDTEDSVVFRGVRSTADFYRDGLRDDVQYYRSLYNVEQVEILRGPNALLFGRVEQEVLSTGLLKRQSSANSWDHLTSVLTVSVHLILPGT